MEPVQTPDLAPDDLAALETDTEWHQLVQEWNNALLPSYSSVCLHESFETQVKQIPEKVALVFSQNDGSQDQHLTYGELNQRANQLAHFLRGQGVGPKTQVGICIERSPEMIVGLLGILKAGGIYVLIDVQSSADQILAVLGNTKTDFLLTRDAVIKNIPFTQLQGLQPASQGLVITSPRAQIKNLDALPFPDRSLVDYRKYDQHLGDGCLKKSVSLMATRGCPYTCVYCHKIWPKSHVARSAPNIFQEILFHYERGYRSFKIMDDVFNLDRRNSAAFFELIIKNNLKIRLSFSNGLRGDILTPSYIDLMVEAGVMDLTVSLETAVPRLQYLIGKKLNIARLRENLVYLCDKYPQVITSLCTMFGFPTETEQDALATLDFVKGIKWLHFALISVVRIFPNTDMARIAIQHGVSEEAIEKSVSLAYHQPGETLPFSKSFVREYQYNYLTEYFLLPERLASVIPAQKQVLTRDEFISKYNDYLPGGLENYPSLSRFVTDDGFYPDDMAYAAEASASSVLSVPDNHEIPDTTPDTNRALRLLLLDLSQHFSSEAPPFSNAVEAPLGLMYLMTYLQRDFGNKIQGKVAKSMIDFDSFEELGALLEDFAPQVIGIRTLSLYRDFFHKTVSLIKQWFPSTLIITGGPYATSEYATILSDRNVDVAVLGEGELTLAELVKRLLENDGKLPKDNVLEQIEGLAFVSRQQTMLGKNTGAERQILLLDKIRNQVTPSISNPEKVNQPTDPACVICTSNSTGETSSTRVSHATIVHLLKTMQAWRHLGHDGGALYHSSAFSVWELWGRLLYGERLVLADEARDWAGAEAFWRRALKGFTTPTPLNLGHTPRLSSQPSYAHATGEKVYAQQTTKLSAETTAMLQSLARQHQLTLNTFVQGAWALLLSHYSGEQDIVFGAVVSNRPTTAPDVESLDGFFDHILPTRVQAPPGDLLLPWLEKLAAWQVELQEYAYSPLIQVQAWSEVPRGLPLFESILIFQSQRQDDRGMKSVYFSKQANCPLTVVASPGPELSLQILYDSRRFEHETTSRILGHFKTLLEGMAIDPNRRLAALPLLTETERHLILVEWNNTNQDHAFDRCAHQIFEAQVKQNPEAVAISYDDEHLTYRELNRRANCLAQCLAEHGTGSEVLVGVLAERGIPFIIAVLAIFKAGGAYLPLDPHHPPKRLAQALIQSSSPLVLIADAFMPVLSEALVDLPSRMQPEVLPIEKLVSHSGGTDNLSIRCLPGHLAYVMFTSGSTGAPKGVMVEHVGMSNHIFAKVRDLGLTDADIVAQTGPQGFDIFMWQCLAAVCTGGRVHIFKDEIVSDPSRLIEEIEHKSVTIVQLVPSVLRALVQEVKAHGAGQTALCALRWMVPTGEALPTELCREWLSLYPHVPLLNTYGSTECSDDQCHWVIDQPPSSDCALPIAPIGRPIPNMQAYTLDRTLAPVPVGVAGELYIGGIGVGRGYLNNAQQTAEIFIPNPFGPNPGARLYRTRDSVRYLPDGGPEGCIEFIGRSDHLVKIHGFRIEPGEIEAALKQHPAVQDAVAMAREDTPGNKYLVAYVVPRLDQLEHPEQEAASLDSSVKPQIFAPELASELRHFVQARLPDYMFPAAFVLLEALPLTSNGKIDRKALPVPDRVLSEHTASFVAPRTLAEQALARIWAKALGVEQVGIHDNFFILGGNSIMSIQIVARAREAGLQLTPRHLYQHQTIAELAVIASTSQTAQAK